MGTPPGEFLVDAPNTVLGTPQVESLTCTAKKASGGSSVGNLTKRSTEKKSGTGEEGKVLPGSSRADEKTGPRGTSDGESECSATPLHELERIGNSERAYLGDMKKTLLKMLEATKRQPNISQVVKTGLAAMADLCDALVTQEKRRTSLQNRLKEEVAKLAKWSPTKKASVGSRKRRKEELTDFSDSEECMDTETDASSEAPMLRFDSDSNAPRAERSKKSKKDLAKDARRKAAREAKREADRMKRIWEEEEAVKLRQEAEKKKRQETKPKQKGEQRKADRRQGRSRSRRRPEALIIKVSENLSYSDALKTLRTKINPDDTGTEIRSVRKTAKGDVLIELEGQAEIKKEFRAAVVGAFGNPLAVANLVPRTSVEIRDLDDLTTEDEVRKVLADKLQLDREEITVFLTNPNSRLQRMAIVEMPEKGVDLLMESARIRMGFVNCRVRRRVQVTRCFKCMGYGHLARDCKGPDRSRQCFRCGSEEHKGAACTATAKCVLCTEQGKEDTHVPGRKGCAAFAEALEQAKKKQR